MPYINLASSPSANLTLTQVRIVDIHTPGEHHGRMRPAVQLFLWIALSFLLFVVAIAVYQVYKTISHLKRTRHEELTTPALLGEEPPTTGSSRSSLSSTLTTDSDVTVVDPYQDDVGAKCKGEKEEEDSKGGVPALVLTSPSLSLKNVPISEFNVPLRHVKPRPLLKSLTGDNFDPALLSPRFIAQERRRMRGRELIRLATPSTPPPRISSRSQSTDDDDDDEPLFKIIERKRSSSTSPPPSPLPIPVPTSESLLTPLGNPVLPNGYDENDEDSIPLGLRVKALPLHLSTPIFS